MKKFLTASTAASAALLLCICSQTASAATPPRDTASGALSTQDAEAYKALIASLERDKAALKDENRRLRQKLRNVRTQLFEALRENEKNAAQNAKAQTPPSAAAKQNISEENIQTQQTQQPAPKAEKEQSFWEWFTE